MPHRAAAEPVGAARPPARSPPAARAQQPITSFFKKKKKTFSNELFKEVEEVGDESWTGT